MVEAVAENAFEQEVLGSERPVLVDFWAEWCAPCRMISPVIDEIAEQYAGKVKVVKVDVDEAGGVAMRYRIASIPTVMLFKDGAEARRWVGVQPRRAYLDALGNL